MADNLFDNIEEQQEIMDITLFLKDFCSEMQEHMAILKVLEGLKNQLVQNSFIEEIKRTVGQQLLLEFVKVFDKANFNKKEENCSVLLMHDKIEKIEGVPCKSEILIRLQALQKEFEVIVSNGNWRNKIVAHHDLKTLNEWKMDVVDFQKVEALIFKLDNVLNLILRYVCFIKYQDQSQANLMKKYKHSLSELCDILNVCKEQGALS